MLSELLIPDQRFSSDQQSQTKIKLKAYKTTKAWLLTVLIFLLLILEVHLKMAHLFA